MKEKKIRSATKMISWRIMATPTTFILVFIVTGNFSLSLGISFFEIILKMTLYYGHERFLDNIKWGTISKEKKEPEILFKNLKISEEKENNGNFD